MALTTPYQRRAIERRIRKLPDPDGAIAGMDRRFLLGRYPFFSDTIGEVVNFVLRISRARASDGVVVRSRDFVARVV